MSVIMVTGGAGGMGRALVHHLAAQGDQPVIADVNLAGAREVADEIGGATTLGLDVTDPVACDRAVQGVVAQYGHIDGVACCAGILLGFDAAVDVTPDHFDRTLRVNLQGTFFTCQAVARAMIDGGYGGSMALVSSGMAQRALGSPAYSASKAGVEALARELAVAWAPHGIRVNAISPGMVETEMSRPAREDPATLEMVMAHTPLRRSARPEEMASVLAFLLGDGASYMSAAVLPVDGGFLSV